MPRLHRLMPRFIPGLIPRLIPGLVRGLICGLVLVGFICLSSFGRAEAPAPKAPPAKATALQTPADRAPVLQPGEGFAMAGTDGVMHAWGEAKKEQPMGSLAKLVWLQLEGGEWAGQGLSFKCTGSMGPYHCWLRTGHGRVDLAKATQESCNLAFLAWALNSADAWKRSYGEGAARARLEDAFRPFLGNRLPSGDTLPELTPEWVGDGSLLRTTPEDMLTWLMDPAQAELLSRCRRLLLNFFVETFVDDAWWMKTGTAPVPSDPGATSAWVVGSNGQITAVLHLPRGRGKAEGLARFREIMGLPAKKK